MLDPEWLIEEFPYIVDQRLPEVQNAGTDELGEMCEELGLIYRAVGVAYLHEYADTDSFIHMLMRSAHTRLFLLRGVSQEEKQQDRYCKASRLGGLFDALASNRFDVAESIVRASAKNRNEQFEYVEDYIYAQVLHGLVSGVAKKDLLDACDKLSDEMSEGMTCRHELCLGLVQGDEVLFDSAFQDYTEIWVQHVISLNESISRNPLEIYASSNVSTEGLAFLRLAERFDLKTRTEYPFCPGLARLPVQKVFEDNLYPR